VWEQKKYQEMENMKEAGIRTRTFIGIVILAAMGMTAFIPVQAAQEQGVIVFHAGSLTVPFAEMEKIFESRHSNLDILRHAGGSTQMTRMISELNNPADIMASADVDVIDKNLIPAKAMWNIRFATNQMVLCYTDQSHFAEAIRADNWHGILSREDVVWGHSDPDLDPCGYRSLMVMQLAEKYYQEPGLYDRLIRNRPRDNIRPKSVELVQLLRTGQMDYAWEYLSVAVQHGLKYVILPDEINLGNYRYNHVYREATVKVKAKKPGTWVTRTGKSCTYGITLVRDAPNREAAIEFLEYVLDPEGGLKVLKRLGQPPLVPCRVPTEEMKNMLPASLRELVAVSD
jgi:molybdate/tungstate transport system substrate-binding protein